VLLISVLLLIVSVYHKSGDEEFSDISNYSYIREEQFTDAMKEIWPEKVIGDPQFAEMKLVSYYDDVTAYTGYLRVKYSEDELACELQRLKSISSDEYIGKYDIKGFRDCDVMAIKAVDLGAQISNGYNGLTYAIDKGEGEIVYVELEFPRGAPREDYGKIIPGEYLPSGLTFPEPV
jgi:hypothetical protein